MKIRDLILFLILVCNINLNAQNFLDGTPEWTYCYKCSSLGGSFEGERTIKYSKDILIQDTIVKLFEVYSYYVNINNSADIRNSMDTLYLYEENDKVYKWLYPESKKELLYNFNSVIQDTLLVNEINCPTDIYFIIDSIGIINVSGETLKSQLLKIESDTWGFWNQIVVVEKLGAISGDYLEVKKQYWCGFDACNNAHKFQNYNNEELGIHYGNMDMCSGITSSKEVDKDDIVVFPNPANNYFEISEIKGLEKLEIYNLNGKLIQTRIINSTLVNINLDPGMYILRMVKSNSKTSLKKLLVLKSG